MNIVNFTTSGAPYIVEAMEKDEGFKSEVKAIIDGIIPALRTLVK